jgi:hypothetical protein
VQVQLSASAIPEYTRNSAVLAIYGNQNNYLQVGSSSTCPFLFSELELCFVFDKRV